MPSSFHGTQDDSFHERGLESWISIGKYFFLFLPTDSTWHNCPPGAGSHFLPSFLPLRTSTGSNHHSFKYLSKLEHNYRPRELHLYPIIERWWSDRGWESLEPNIRIKWTERAHSLSAVFMLCNRFIINMGSLEFSRYKDNWGCMLFSF